MSTMDDGSLVLQAMAGDRDAFAEIVQRHQQAVFNVAFRLLQNVQDSEDAAQETFVRAYQFLKRYETNRPLSPWLKKIAVNVCLNRLQAQETTVLLDEEQTSGSDPNPGPEAMTVLRSREDRIRLELSRLPPRYRAVIELRHFQDLSYEEIARELSRPLSDIKSDLFRARRLLAERLKDIP